MEKSIVDQIRNVDLRELLESAEGYMVVNAEEIIADGAINVSGSIQQEQPRPGVASTGWVVHLTLSIVTDSCFKPVLVFATCGDADRWQAGQAAVDRLVRGYEHLIKMASFLHSIGELDASTTPAIEEGTRSE